MNNEQVFKGNGIGEFRVNIAEIVETGITDARILSDNTEHLPVSYTHLYGNRYNVFGPEF